MAIVVFAELGQLLLILERDIRSRRNALLVCPVYDLD